MTEDEMVGWHHRLDGHEFEPVLGDDDGQGSLVCCSPWDCKNSDITERLINNNHLYAAIFSYTQHFNFPYLKTLIFYIKIFEISIYISISQIFSCSLIPFFLFFFCPLYLSCLCYFRSH